MTKSIFFIIFIIIPAIATATSQDECLEFHVINNSHLGLKNSHIGNTGVHWEYLEALEKETGFCINKTILPNKRMWKNIKEGKHDGGIMFKSDSHSNIVEYVALVHTVKTVVIPIIGVDIKDYQDLYELSIGKTRGVALSGTFDHDPKLNITELNHYNQVIQMIKLGRLDAIAGCASALDYHLKVYDAVNKVDYKSKLDLGEKQQWLQFSKKSKHLDKIPIFKKAIEKLRLDGTFKLIMNKQYGDKWKQIND